MKIHLLWISALLIGLSFMPAITITQTMVEICDNALDDDGDGLVDLNDPDCECFQNEPESLIPNPSFEEQNCCPSGRSQLGCAVDWIQASEPTTDYIHLCGWLGWDNLDAPMPFPDGEGIIGFRDGRSIQGVAEPTWKEYVGACLTAPLKAGTEYSFEFYVGFIDVQISPTIAITFFGTNDCEFLPFGVGNASLGCPTNGPNWERLESVRVGGAGWVKARIKVKPDQDINAIAIGPSCELISSSVNLYYFFDNLVLAESRFFPKSVFDVGNSCTEDFELMVDEEPNATYQWYKDGVAIVGETSSSYRPMLQDGNYSVLQYLDGACNLSNPYSYRVSEESTLLSEVICEDEVLDFGNGQLNISGDYVDTLKTEDGCDSILFLNLKVLGSTQDSISERIFPDDELQLGNFTFSDEGKYNVILDSKEGCDSLIYLDLLHYKVYIPNSFSPNEDGFNDLFEVFIEEPDVVINSISVFNRWGNKVYHSVWGIEEENGFWDGRSGNGELGQGVYTYMIEFKVGNDYTKVIKGDVSIIL